MTRIMRILAIDPSIVKLGVAVLDGTNLKHFGTYKTKKEGDLRYKEIALFVQHIIEEYKPEMLAIESQYFTGLQSNSILKTCEVKGVCCGAFYLATKSARIISVAPTAAKKYFGVTGKRKDAKKDMIKMVQMTYPQTKVKGFDDNAADAIAIGLSANSQIY